MLFRQGDDNAKRIEMMREEFLSMLSKDEFRGGRAGRGGQEGGGRREAPITVLSSVYTTA